MQRDLRERRLSVKGSAHCPEAVQQMPCEKADADQRHPRSAGPVAANVEDPAGSPTQLSLPEPEMGGYRQDGAADQRPETRPAANTPGNQKGGPRRSGGTLASAPRTSLKRPATVEVNRGPQFLQGSSEQREGRGDRRDEGRRGGRGYLERCHPAL